MVSSRALAVIEQEVERIVQEHGGNLEIFSEVGKRTTARIVLPVMNKQNGAFLRDT